MTTSRSRYDDLHDRLAPIETKKAGTRYERLVAFVQKSLDETAGVSHDLRLIGEDTQVKHQIDVTITKDNQRRRVLIECKDFDISGDPVGLGILRDFFGVVDDVKPDEAIVITCNGFTEDARRYAKGKNIKLAVLRAYKPEDDEGTIKSVEVTAEFSIPHDYNAFIEFASEAGRAAFGAAGTADRSTEIYLMRPGRERTQLVVALDELFYDPELANDEVMDDGTRRKVFSLIACSVQCGSGTPIAISRVFIGYRLATETRTFVVHAPIVALILTPVGGDTDLLIFEETLKRYRIDAETGKVEPR